MKRALLLLLPVLLTYSCKKVDSNDLKDDVPYHQAYYIGYDKDANSINASAIARVRDGNGTKVEFSNGAGFTANGKAASVDLFDKAIYRWSLTGLTDVNFVMTKNSGAKVTNTVTVADMGSTDFSSTIPGEIYRYSGLSFTWAGDALVGNDEIAVSVTADSGSLQKTITATNSSNTISFTPTDLNKVKVGTLKIEMKRTRYLALKSQDGTATGNIQVAYTTRRSTKLKP